MFPGSKIEEVPRIFAGSIIQRDATVLVITIKTALELERITFPLRNLNFKNA
jgi:hypothetical protein